MSLFPAPAGGKLAPGLYHRRWQIETTYDEPKVVQGLDRTLRSRTPESVAYEVAGHVVLYLLVRWLMVEAAAKHSLDPLQISFTNALHELDSMRTSLIAASPHWAATTLLPHLLDRIASHQVQPRPGRHYPRRKKAAASKKSRTRASTKSRKKRLVPLRQARWGRRQRHRTVSLCDTHSNSNLLPFFAYRASSKLIAPTKPDALVLMLRV